MMKVALKKRFKYSIMKRTVFNYAADEGLLLGFHGCDRQLALTASLEREGVTPGAAPCRHSQLMA